MINACKKTLSISGVPLAFLRTPGKAESGLGENVVARFAGQLYGSIYLSCEITLESYKMMTSCSRVSLNLFVFVPIHLYI